MGILFKIKKNILKISKCLTVKISKLWTKLWNLDNILKLLIYPAQGSGIPFVVRENKLFKCYEKYI
jgi:hypothetical protein